MVDTNQEPLQDEATANKKKESPAKAAAKGKSEDKGNVKKLPVRKDNNPVKGQGPAKSTNAPKGETITKLQKFLKGSWAELKKVHWPNRRQIITFTSVVLFAVLLVAVMIFAVDSVLSKVLDFIIPK